MTAAALALLGLAFGGLLLASGGSSSRRGAVTPATRRRVRETLDTSNAAASSLPVETPPAPVDPDRAAQTRRAGATSTTSSGGTRTQSAWAAARGSASSSSSSAPSSSATTTTTGTPSSAPESLTITPPTEADDAGADAPAEEVMRDPDEARRLAAGTATAIRERSSGWRNRLRAFQRAAGIAADGRYGGLSYNALIYYGIRNPPPARSRPRPDEAAANYVDRVITAGSTVAGAGGAS